MMYEEARALSSTDHADQRKPRIRPAERTDAPLLAWAVREASRGHLETGLMDVRCPFLSPDGLLAFLQEMIEDDSPSCLRWDGFLIAEVDGQPSAVLNCYGPREKPLENYCEVRDRIVARQNWPDEWQQTFRQRVNDFESVMLTMPGEHEHWMIEWVATKPELRRQGLVRCLLQEALAKGRQSGYDRAQVSVIAENQGAIAAYKKVGFEEFNTVTSPLVKKHLPSVSGVMTLRMKF